MPVFRLSDKVAFPSPEHAEPNGLLAVGGDLSPERLLMAYRKGIFPWYTDGQPILWWSPDPRCVLIPEEFHLPRRLARTIRQGRFTVTADQAFADVIAQCALARIETGSSTWITEDMLDAFVRLHELGFAHSVECWDKENLVGGLYGLCLDGVFFGESMFSRTPDSSKVALARLVHHAPAIGIRMIDCQITSDHLLRFGAREIPRRTFQTYLRRYIPQCRPQKKWRLQ